MKKLALLTVLLFLAGIAHSASWDNAKGVGLNFGANKFLGLAEDKAAVGQWAGFSLRYGFTPNFLLQLDADYGSFQPVKPGSDFKADPNAMYRTFLAPVDLTFKATPFGESWLKPYFMLGTGFLAWNLMDISQGDYSILGDQKVYWGKSVHDGQINISFTQGLGIELGITSALSLDLQARYTFFSGQDKDNVGLNDVNDEFLEGRVALVYYFDYFKDTDKDGIEDKKDADPLKPEDFDGFQDQDGAPDYDNDNDGVLDAVDKAPLDPEDRDGFQDEDGVPDPDNDGDGILDINDKAPNEAEDKDGFQDADGAPDLDNDGDGILDKDDKCPDKAETKNDYQDEDGCPDSKPMPQLEKAGAKLILQGVNFETGSANLTQSSFEILDKVVVGLIDNTEVELEIRGYTDDVGAEAANQKLSERRANTVMQYLVSKGVAASRLKAFGYGEKDPIASNKTAEGRAQNRRIEFYRSK